MTRQPSDVKDAKGEADPAVPLPCVLDITGREQGETGTQVLAAAQAAQDQLPADWLITALRSIGDAVIATDAAGHVRFLNQVATDLTGWVPEEAIGQPLDHIFRIVNEATRSPVENPVEKVLETGHIVGLANHTLLIARDTTERHIDDSRLPIRDERGHITGVILVFRDISERKRAEERERESEIRFRMLFEAMAEGFCVVEVLFDDHNRPIDYRFLEVNPAFEKQTGIKDARGRLMRQIAPDHEQHWFDTYGRIALTGETLRFESQAAALHRWYEVLAFRVGPAELRRVGIVFNDISERKRADEERGRSLAATQAAGAEAEAANRMKDEFLATVSHELRTPLNAILGWARILRSGKADADDLEQGLAAIERNSLAQAQLIEDLLDISRITAGNLRLDLQRLSLAEVIEAALAAVMPAADAKGIPILKVLDSLAGPVTGDFTRLRQIVWNLLANAVKFTPKGGKVQILLERVNSHVEISVIDTGIGITPEFLPHVFDRFRQADGGTTRRHDGLGLGLAIVKHLAEMHGGTVRAKSPGEGQGATFVVTLPITVVHPEQPEPKKVPPKEPAATKEICQDGLLAGIKVLVVDDEPDARQLLRRVLAACHAEVALAASAAEALELVEGFRPDVIVSDIGMPDTDGYDLIRRVRAVYTARQIPAAALTAFARTEDRKRALLAGFQTHIAKPVDPAELTAAVASLACRTGTSDQHKDGTHDDHTAANPRRR